MRNEDPEGVKLSPVLTPQSSFLNPHSSVLTSQSSILSPQSSILNPRSSILNPQSSVLNPLSSVPNPQSSIFGHQSAILNPWSSVRSPQSNTSRKRNQGYFYHSDTTRFYAEDESKKIKRLQKEKKKWPSEGRWYATTCVTSANKLCKYGTHKIGKHWFFVARMLKTAFLISKNLIYGIFIANVAKILL